MGPLMVALEAEPRAASLPLPLAAILLLCR
jgi:hypothetical protein